MVDTVGSHLNLTGLYISLLCFDVDHLQCTYPLDSEPLENLLIKRKPEDLVNSLKRKRRRIDLNRKIYVFLLDLSYTFTLLVGLLQFYY